MTTPQNMILIDDLSPQDALWPTYGIITLPTQKADMNVAVMSCS